MRILTCYIAADSGQASVGGFSCRDQSLDVRRILGYLPEAAPLYTEMNVVDYLGFIAEIHGMGSDKKARIEKMIETTGLSDVVYKDIYELSKGYRQRVGLATALIHDPEYLILDEPTSGLDPNQIVEIRHLIREIGHDRNRCVILSTHILPEVEATCDRAIIINDGKIIAEGTTTELSGFARGSDVYRVGVIGNPNLVEAAFRSQNNISEFTLKADTGNNHLIYDLVTKADRDISEDIFDLAVSKGFKLTKLSREVASLEDIFRTLTIGEANLK
jgi:ABC-2 type transport system ATP-binding protein